MNDCLRCGHLDHVGQVCGCGCEWPFPTGLIVEAPVLVCQCDPSHGAVCGCGKPMCVACCHAVHETCPCSCPGCNEPGAFTDGKGNNVTVHICGKENV